MHRAQLDHGHELIRASEKDSMSEVCVRRRCVRGENFNATLMISDLVHGVGRQRVAALRILQEFQEFIRKSNVLQERNQIDSSEEKREEQ